MSFIKNNTKWEKTPKNDYSDIKKTDDFTESRYIYEKLEDDNLKWIRVDDPNTYSVFNINAIDNYNEDKYIRYNEDKHIRDGLSEGTLELRGVLKQDSGGLSLTNGTNPLDAYKVKFNIVKQETNQLHFNYYDTYFNVTGTSLIDVGDGDKIIKIDIELSRKISETLSTTEVAYGFEVSYYINPNEEISLYDSSLHSEVLKWDGSGSILNKVFKGYMYVYFTYTGWSSGLTYTLTGQTYTPVNQVFIGDGYYKFGTIKEYFVTDKNLILNDKTELIPLTEQGTNNKDWEYSSSDAIKAIGSVTDENILSDVNMGNLNFKYNADVFYLVLDKFELKDKVDTKIGYIFKSYLDNCKISLDFRTYDTYTTYTLESTYINTRENFLIDTNKISFSYYHDLSGTVYRYITSLDNINKIDHLSGDGNSLVNYYNEYDLIDNEVKNMINVDYIITNNVNLSSKRSKLDNENLNTSAVILLIGQKLSQENDVYIHHADGKLRLLNRLDSTDKSYKFSAVASYGILQDEVYFLNPNSNGIFPVEGEEKEFINGKTLIIKNEINYNVSDYTSKPKYLIPDSVTSRSQVYLNGEKYSNILLEDSNKVKEFEIKYDGESTFKINTDLSQLYNGSTRHYITNDTYNDLSGNIYKTFERKEDLLLLTLEYDTTSIIDLQMFQDKEYDDVELIFDIRYDAKLYSTSFLKIKTKIKTVPKSVVVTNSAGVNKNLIFFYIEDYDMSDEIISYINDNDNLSYYVKFIDYIKSPVTSIESVEFMEDITDCLSFNDISKYFEIEVEENDISFEQKTDNYRNYNDYNFIIDTNNYSTYFTSNSLIYSESFFMSELTENLYLKSKIHEFMTNVDIGYNSYLSDTGLWDRVVPKAELTINAELFEYPQNATGNILEGSQTGEVQLVITKSVDNDIFSIGDTIKLSYYESQDDENEDIANGNVNNLKETDACIRTITYRDISFVITFEANNLSIETAYSLEMETNIESISNYIYGIKDETTKQNAIYGFSEKLIRSDGFKNNFTGILFQNLDKKYVTKITEKYVNDPNITYEAEEILRIGANKKTAMPINIKNIITVPDVAT